MTCTPRLDVLSNNIRLLHAFEELPVVYCGFAINVGARDEHGIAHFIEHLLFKGTRRRSNMQIIKRLEDVGGELNAYTTKEETFVYATVPRKYAERAIELLADIVLDSTFPQEELVKEREVVFEEIEMYNDSPSELIFDDFENAVFSGHPLGNNILGKASLLRTYTSEHAKDFTRRMYRPSNMVFFAYGELDFRWLVRSLKNATQHFPNALPHIDTHEGESLPPYQAKEIIRKMDTHQAHVMLAINVACPSIWPITCLADQV